MNLERKTTSTIFTFLIVSLMILPFITTFNEFLTSIIENIGIYKQFQDLIVPYLVRMVAVILSIGGISTQVGQDTLFLVAGAKQKAVYVSWNCIGWQSLVLFILSLITGLSGRFTKYSLIQVLLIGFLGTGLFNIFRISLIALVAFYIGRLPAMLIHDYLSILLTIFWLFFFWWFVFKFVLETKEVSPNTF